MATKKEVVEEVEEVNFTVDDVEVLKPQVKPLIITPKGKEWANDAQASFAKTLNGYAYKNPTKWATKKTALLKQLADLESNPDEIGLIEGRTLDTNTRLEFSNNTYGAVVD